VSCSADTRHEAALSFAGLDAGYGTTPVIRDVSLDVAEGEFVGIIGPNGAGKSTLLKAVTGAADVLAGSVRVCGGDSRQLDAQERARRIAVVPQTLPEPFSFSSREFVEMGRYPYLGRFDRMGVEDTDAVLAAMRVTDTIELSDQPVRTLSGGDLQRLTLAQALAQEPSVLLLDEPTSHLDLNHQLQVLDLVKSRLPDGLAVLGVFHDIGLAARYADRIAVVSDGRLKAVGAPGEVINAHVVRDVFGVRAVVGSDPVTGTVTVTPILREREGPAADAKRVLVIGGSGSAATIMRDLVEAGYEVVAGALNEGDVDQAVAEALGVPHLKLPPFGEMDGHAEKDVLVSAVSASVCVVAAVPFGRANLGNLRAVADSGTPVVLVGTLDDSRDFTGGDALRVAQELVSSGARPVSAPYEVASAVSGLVGAAEGSG
jgi:iron complex transport system ATP-binding protein